MVEKAHRGTDFHSGLSHSTIRSYFTIPASSQIHTAKLITLFSPTKGLVQCVFCEFNQAILCVSFSKFTVPGLGRDILAVDFTGKQMKERISATARGRWREKFQNFKNPPKIRQNSRNNLSPVSFLPSFPHLIIFTGVQLEAKSVRNDDSHQHHFD